MLPKEVLDGWQEREKAVVLTTVSTDGMPNSIWATCADLYDQKTVVVADNYFSKTKQNILAGTLASVLFLTKERKSYQLKGTVSYHTEGPYFDFMKTFNPARHPGHGALVIHVQEAYSGAQNLL
jgi:hypothetical protein